jgi:hypothetical protein
MIKRVEIGRLSRLHKITMLVDQKIDISSTFVSNSALLVELRELRKFVTVIDEVVVIIQKLQCYWLSALQLP